jgi:hypothetical protein
MCDNFVSVINIFPSHHLSISHEPGYVPDVGPQIDGLTS